MDIEGILYLFIALLFLLYSQVIINRKPVCIALIVMISGLCVYTIINKFSPPYFIEKSLLYIDEIFIVILFLNIFIKNVFKRKIKIERIDLIIIFFLTSGIISSLINKVPLNVTCFGLFLQVKGYLLYWSIANLSGNSKYLQYQHILGVIKKIGVFILIFALTDLFFSEPFRNIIFNSSNIEYRFGIPSVKSIFTTYSVFGWCMSILFFVYFSEFLVNSRYKTLTKAIVYLVFIILSMRVKAIISSFFAASMLMLILSNKVKDKVTKYTAPLFFILFIVIIFFQPLKMLVEAQLNKYIIGIQTIHTARNVLAKTSIEIAKDNFPFGAGFGRFGGQIAKIHYSPLYYSYGLSNIYGLDDEKGEFLNDTFWPCIIGETGITGCFFYVWFLVELIILSHKYVVYGKIANKEIYFFSYLVLMAAIVDSIAQSIFTRNPQYFLIFFILGCTRLSMKQPVIYFKKEQIEGIHAFDN